MVDRILSWVDDLPGPAEVWLLTAGVTLALMGNLILWGSGSAQPGQFDSEVVVASALAGMFLALSAFMRRTASAAFEDFRPALADEANEAAERRRLLSIPSRAFIVWAAATAILTNTLYLVYIKPTAAPRSPFEEIVVAAAWLVFAIVLGLVIAQTITQLRSVRHLGEVAGKIDVLNSGPVDALSRVTAVGAGGLLVVITAANVGVPATASAYVALDVVIIVFALAAFILPLQVMHRRLSRQRAELLTASTERLKGILDAVHRAADTHDYTSADPLNKMLASAIAERDLLTRLPTWPWTTTTIRGFGSALLLPVVIFVITRGIEHFV